MPRGIRRWLSELKAEAPWYFWVYVGITPLGYLVFYQESMILCSLTALAAYVFLLKTFALLRSPSVYIFAVAAYFVTDGYVIEYFLGENLHLYFSEIYNTSEYPAIYSVGISAACAAPAAGACALLHKRSPTHALKVCVTTFFMLVANIGGILMTYFFLVGPFLVL